MANSNPERKRPCRCTVCNLFPGSGSAVLSWGGTGMCDLCVLTSDRADQLTPDQHLVDLVPTIVKQFFGITTVCWPCRNSLNWYVTGRAWHLCWGDSPDELLQWAMAEWLLDRLNSKISGACSLERASRSLRPLKVQGMIRAAKKFFGPEMCQLLKENPTTQLKP